MAGNQNLPTENINEVILRLLKIKSGTEMDYQTYFNIIKKRLAAHRMAGAAVPIEEDQLLREELKRVGRLKDKGRFTAKTKTVRVASAPPPPSRAPGSGGSGGGNGNPPRTGQIVKTKGSKVTVQNFFNTEVIKPVSVKDVTDKSIKVDRGRDKDKTLDFLQRINKTLESILGTLTNIGKQDASERERQRKESESKKRSEKERGLESKTFEGLKKVVSTLIKPFQSIWDRIVNFIFYTLLGRVFVKLIDWFADPKNQSKVKSLIRFIGDWWPALLGGYILFGTSFGRLIRATTGIVGRFIFQIGKVAIPQLLKFIRTPLGMGAALFTAGATIPAMFPGTVNEQERKISKSPGSKEDKIKQLQQQKANLNLFEKLQGKGSEIDEQISYLQTGKTKAYGFSGGGFSGGLNLSGLVSGAKGKDKVPAMLTDGEFVMSVGAVNKYGVDTLEAMNAAGGGTNQPTITNGVTYAYSGGPVGDRNNGSNNTNKNLPFSKDPIDGIKRFIKHRFGVDVDRPPTWGPRLPSSIGSGSNDRDSSPVSTGSLLTDPLGAAMRIGKQFKMPSPNLPSGGIKLPKVPGLPSGGIKLPKVPGLPGLPSPKEDGFLNNLKSATYRDAGTIYAKQMLGGFGGPVSERDLSKESKAELQKAIGRAKKRTGSEIAKAEAKIKELESSGASKTPKGKEALATQKSFLKKLKEGGIRVQYTDYADEKGNMSESAKNAKNILGQFWAKERSKKEGGGYRIEDKYDFDMFKKQVKDPKTGKMVERDFTGSELWNEGVLGKGKTTQQRLQAAYLLNPFKGKGDVDMVLGGKRTAAESWGLTGSKTMLGGMLGISGKPKTKNEKALEAKRPWWDKMGWFGGASAKMQNDKKANQGFLNKNPGAKLYSKPKPNTGTPYKSRFARPVSTTTKTKPVKPPVKPSPKPSSKTYRGGQRGSGAKPNTTQRAPSPSPRHRAGTKTTERTTGTKR